MRITMSDGVEREVAFDELALFFNNNTIIYGHSLLRTGMTKDEAITALEEGGFTEEVAEAFWKRLRANGLHITDGRVVL